MKSLNVSSKTIIFKQGLLTINCQKKSNTFLGLPQFNYVIYVNVPSLVSQYLEFRKPKAVT